MVLLPLSRTGRIVFLATCVTFLLFLIKYQWNYHPPTEHIIWRQELLLDPFLYPRPWTLINLTIRYLINNLVCKSGSHISLLILITSHPGDVEIRHKIRQMIPQKELERLEMRRLFLMARVGDSSKVSSPKYKTVTFKQIQKESEEHQDVLVGDFVESYKNLTYKHLMGLEWVGRYCPQAEFVLKQDDDIIVDFYQLSGMLQQPSFVGHLAEGRHILGKVLSKQEVIRDPKSKWYVTHEMYPDNFFPPFVSGWAYITTPIVAEKLVNASKNLDYLWIDDMHVTGTLRKKADVGLFDLDPYFTIYKGQVECCVATPQQKASHSASLVPYWCDYLVGVPNDDLQLMEIFHAHAKFCHTSKMCRRREGPRKLANTCVITPNMIVNNFHFKESQKMINNKGSWKPMKIYQLIYYYSFTDDQNFDMGKKKLSYFRPLPDSTMTTV